MMLRLCPIAVSMIVASACLRPITHTPPERAPGEAALVIAHSAGAVFALRGDRTSAYLDAEHKIVAHCTGPYRIVSEYDVAVGPNTEYRVTYLCASGEAGEHEHRGEPRNDR